MCGRGFGWPWQVAGVHVDGRRTPEPAHADRGCVGCNRGVGHRGCDGRRFRCGGAGMVVVDIPAGRTGMRMHPR